MICAINVRLNLIRMFTKRGNRLNIHLFNGRCSFFFLCAILFDRFYGIISCTIRSVIQLILWHSVCVRNWSKTLTQCEIMELIRFWLVEMVWLYSIKTSNGYGSSHEMICIRISLSIAFRSVEQCICFVHSICVSCLNFALNFLLIKYAQITSFN